MSWYDPRASKMLSKGRPRRRPRSTAGRGPLCRRDLNRHLAVEALEDRAMLAVDFGFAVGFGGTGTDQGLDIATDAAGNSYVTGLFQGTVDFDPGPGTANLIGAGILDAFVAKYDSDGNLTWAGHIGGAGDVRGTGIALDAAGNVHVVGRFNGTADVDPGVAGFNLTAVGKNDIFVVKLDNNGNFVWGAQLGGSGFENVSQGIAVDTAGNVFTTGQFQDTADADFDPGPGFFNPVVNGGGANDIFISKLDSGGNFVWALGMGGPRNDGGAALTTDAAGNLYVAGTFQFTADLDPGPGVANRTSAGSDEVFVQKLDPAGNLVWVSAMGGPRQDIATDIALDGAGNVITVGHFASTMDFDPGPGTANISSVAGSNDGFVSKLDNAGNFVWAKTLGSPGDERISGVVTDGDDSVWTTGHFEQTTDFDPGAGAFELTSAGSQDVFVWQLDANGDFLDALSVGGTNADSGNRIALDNANVLITGRFEETVDFDPGAGTTELTSAGGNDIFVLKLTQVQTAEIDIKPGSDPNSINLLRSNGVLPVAILTTGAFDAATVDTSDLSTIQFGDPDVVPRVSPLRTALEDVDGDGDIDLIMHFSVPEIRSSGALVTESTEALLTAVTTGGDPFAALDSVRIVPPGDANNDQIVNAADYTLWADNFGRTDADLIHGDFNGDRLVDAADYTIWSNNFGLDLNAPAAAAVAVQEDPVSGEAESSSLLAVDRVLSRAEMNWALYMLLDDLLDDETDE